MNVEFNQSNEKYYEIHIINDFEIAYTKEVANQMINLPRVKLHREIIIS
jgi:hypothetical protein